MTATKTSVPRMRSSPPSPVNGQRIDDAAVADGERRDPREQLEHDREALAAARPRVAAVDRHSRKRPVRVERGRDRERPRIRRAAGSRARARRRRTAPRRPDTDPSDPTTRAPAAPRGLRRSSSHTVASAIARHGLSARQTFPNRTERSGTPSQKIDVDERRREVQELGRRPEERGREREDEERDRERPGGRPAARARARTRLSARGSAARPRALRAAAASRGARAGRTRRRGRSPPS